MFVRINEALEASRLKRAEGDKGFTLIELLVVVIIIGILAAIAIPIYLGQQESAKDSAVKSDLANAKIAITAAVVDAPNTTSLVLAPTTAVGPTGGTTKPLTDYGFTKSENTVFDLTAIDPTTAFCIEAHRGDKTTSVFSIKAGGGVKAEDCP